jgi:hypothetical protein
MRLKRVARVVKNMKLIFGGIKIIDFGEKSHFSHCSVRKIKRDCITIHRFDKVDDE